MLRIAHVSDIHFRGLQRHSEYKECSMKMFEQMREQKVHAVFVGGDIVHSKVQNITPELIELLGWWFDELGKIAPTMVMLGNHDGLIYNPDRLDTITPILRSLNNPNIKLCRDSGIYTEQYTDESNNTHKVNWHIFSPFDEHKGAWENITKIPIDKNSLNIAGFHGPVANARTDINWQIESSIKPDFFSRYDFAMLGDIHQYQSVDLSGTKGWGRVVYSGSMIQQNFGEDVDKGWVLWEIKDSKTFKHQLMKVPNPRPFINLKWEKDPQTTVANGLKELRIKEIPVQARVRLLAPNNISRVLGTRVSEILKGLGHQGYFKIHNVLSENEKNGDKQSELKEIDHSTLNLFDLETYNEMYELWLREGGLPPIEKKDDDVSEDYKKKFEEQCQKAISRLRGPLEEIKRENDRLSNVQWSIDRVEWDNVFAYGEGNLIDFKEEGWGTIFGVFGPNGVGKSTVVAVLMYALYNSTDRGAMSNGEIINDSEDWCEARVFLTVNGRQLRVVRRTDKVERSTRSKEKVTNFKTSLSVQEKQDDSWVDLSGEQRRDTDKILRELIGGPEDFVTVSLAPQGGALAFVESGGSVRRNTLMRLLDLTVIDELNKKIKEMSVEDRAWAKKGKGVISLTDQMSEHLKEIEVEQNNLENVEKKREKSKEELSSIQFALSKDQHERVEYLQNRLLTLESELTKKELTEERFHSHLLKYKSTLEEINKVLSSSKGVDFENKRNNLKSRIQTLSEIREKIRSIQRDVAANEKVQESLKDIPCGEQFPTCPYIKNALIAKNENVQFVKVLNDIGNVGDDSQLQKELKEVEEEISKLQEARIRGKELESRVIESLQDYQNAKKDTIDAREEIEKTRLALSDLGDAVEAGKGDTLMVQRYESLKREIANSDERLIQIKTTIGVLKHKIEVIEKEIEEAKEFEERLHHWDSLLDFLSAKGLIKMIMQKQLPVLNSLVDKALGDFVDFSVKMEMPDDSKSLEVFLIWGDKERSVETASGMQKLISAIAIRSALHAITPLPKSDIFVLDEGFGALDPDNLEGCFQMLDLYRKTYRHILLISHIDSVKEAVDIPLTVTVDTKGYSNLRHGN